MPAARTGTFERSLEQRQEALRRANRIRTTRARLKQAIKEGHVPVAPLLADPPEDLSTMRVYELLLAVPKLGEVKAGAMLARARVSPSKTLGGLSERQRQDLGRELG